MVIPRGLHALSEFSEIVHEISSKFLAGRVVIAKSLEHQLATSLALLGHISKTSGSRRVPTQRVSWSKVDRWCKIFSKLDAAIEMSIQDSDITSSSVTQHTVDEVQAIIDRLYAKLAEEGQLAYVAEQDTLSLRSAQSENVLRQLKAFKGSSFHTLESLWHPAENNYTSDPDIWAQLLMEEASARQGSPRGDVTRGSDLLHNWSMDLTSCRLALDDAEVEQILLDAPTGKAPGPDGVPACCFKVFARYLVPVFQEAWAELLNGQASEHVGLRKWTIAPKEAGVNTLAKLRDLEICSEARKVLARMMNKILDEVFCNQLHETQQAFLSVAEIFS